LVCNEGELAGSSATIPDAAMGTVSIIPVNSAGLPGVVETANFSSFDATATIASLKAAGVRFFGAGVPSTDFEPEYLAISPDGTKAMVTLQEANAVAILDIATATFTSVAALGEKDFSTGRHDFSDRDGAGGASGIANPTTGNPVFGLYMPDAIASYQVGGQTYSSPHS
jgi:DNA-binding beta-propeller fold protein YncE